MSPSPGLPQVHLLQKSSCLLHSPGLFEGATTGANDCKQTQTQGPGRNRLCPFCPGGFGRIGPPASEFHVTWVCPKVENVRKVSGITWYKNQLSLNLVSDSDSFYSYVNGFDTSGEKISQYVMNNRVQSLSSVRSAWLKLVP